MSAGLNDDAVSLRLEAFAGEDHAFAEAAFAQLWEAAGERVMRQMARRGLTGAEADDAAQEVRIRLWQRRGRMTARTHGEWYALVRVVARGEIAQRLRERPPPPLDIPDEDLPYLDALVAAADEIARIYEAADGLWLGETAEPERTHAAAAAKLVLVDGATPEEVAAMFGTTEADVARWLMTPEIVARAAFAALCWPPDALAGYVLRPERPLSAEEIDRASKGSLDVGVAPEVARVVFLSVRHGMNEEQIARALGDGAGRQDVERVLRAALASYPFRAIARALLASVEALASPNPMAGAGLWKRMVLEYHSRQDLPHRHVLQRVGPAAQEAGFKIEETTLFNWLSSRRLYAELAAYLAEVGR